MRWEYVDQNRPDERGLYQNRLGAIDAWWEAFASHAQAITDTFGRRADVDLPAFMDQYLAPVDPHLMWEYGPAVKGKGHRLVITPEAHAHLRPLVTTLLSRAPKLKGWEFYPYRLAEDVAEAQSMVQTRQHGTIEKTTFTANVGKHHLIDITFLDPATSGSDDRQAMGNAFVATETLLGEQILDEWIGCIQVARPQRLGLFGKVFGKGDIAKTLSLPRLKPTVDALIASIRDQLPPDPLFVRATTELPYRAAERKPRPAADYAGFDDLLCAVTPYADLWMAEHTSGLFRNKRFSRCNETFCYLKIDSTQVPRDQLVAFRTSIEDRLGPAMVSRQLGCMTGGGSGLAYSYIDLALTDMAKAIPVILTSLQDAKAPTRSWLLFFEPTHAEEWIGMYPQAPAPPTRPEADSKPADPPRTKN